MSISEVFLSPYLINILVSLSIIGIYWILAIPTCIFIYLKCAKRNTPADDDEMGIKLKTKLKKKKKKKRTEEGEGHADGE